MATAYLTNSAFGFGPRGTPRRVRPKALICVHVTGNRRTAKDPDLHGAARDERNYANRAGSNGPSAHAYIARDGWVLHSVDWKRFAAWSNGDVLEPNLDNPGIVRAVRFRKKGYNVNEAYWLEVEAVGFGTKWPITDDQKASIAELVRKAAAHSGLPINRETVHGHWEINGVNRRNCPVPSRRERFLKDIIALAKGGSEEEVVDTFTTPKEPSVSKVPNGTHLYAASDLANTAWVISPGRDMPYYGEALPGVALIQRVDEAGDATGEMLYARASDIGEPRVASADCAEEAKKAVALAVADLKARSKIVIQWP